MVSHRLHFQLSTMELLCVDARRNCIICRDCTSQPASMSTLSRGKSAKKSVQCRCCEENCWKQWHDELHGELRPASNCGHDKMHGGSELRRLARCALPLQAAGAPTQARAGQATELNILQKFVRLIQARGSRSSCRARVSPGRYIKLREQSTSSLSSKSRW